MKSSLNSGRRFHRAAIASLAALASLASVKAATIAYETGFSIPPYTSGSTIVGVDGWTQVAGVSTDSVVVSAPWDSNETVLRLQKAAIPNANINLRKTLSTPLTGIVEVKLSAAFDYTTVTNTGFIFSFQNQGSSSGNISFGMNFQTGLYYRYREPGSTTSTTVSLLELSDVKTLSIYDFSLTVDMTNKKFNFAVSGLKADNSVYSYSVQNVDFLGLTQVADLYLWQSSTMAAYVDDLSVQQVPEPGTSALLALSTLGAGFYAFKRRKLQRPQI